MRCRNCVSEVGEGVRFCPNCGIEMKPGVEATQVAQQPVQPSYQSSRQPAYQLSPEELSNAGTYRMGACVVVLVALLLFLVSAFVPWWHLDMRVETTDATIDTGMDFYMGDKISVVASASGNQTTDISRSGELTHSEAGFDESGVGIGSLILAGSILIALLSLFALLSYVKSHPRLGNGLCIVSLSLAVLAVVLFGAFYPSMATIPAGSTEPIIKNLFGSSTTTFQSLTWTAEYSPTTGFYLFLIGLILLGVSVVLGMLWKKELDFIQSQKQK